MALALMLAPSPLTPGVAAQETAHEGRRDHRGHGQHEGEGGQAASPLQEPGNAAFAAIQEVVAELNRREDTDWEEIDLEALRRHLRDMHHFTLEARVVEREPIEGGLRVTVRGPDAEATDAIRRALDAHAPMLEEEEGWSVNLGERDDRTVLRVTGSTPADAERIRGLGYIGLMATSAHHTRHHWMIATGRSPHRH